MTDREDASRDGSTVPRPGPNAVITWRYLRLAMVALVVGLAASVLIEHGRVADCWQQSLSAYYYTPAQGIFVGALVTIGICLVCLRGKGMEDVLLNFAGFFAPFVALVPTKDPGRVCGAIAADIENRNRYIANNVRALFVIAAFALLVLFVLWLWGRSRKGFEKITRVDVIGFTVAVALLVLAASIFFADPEAFRSGAHGISASLLFVCIFGTVVYNARDLKESSSTRGQPAKRANRYSGIAVLMALVALFHGAAWLYTSQTDAEWDHLVLSVEASMIILFALFWMAQTLELWNEGLRPGTPADRR